MILHLDFLTGRNLRPVRICLQDYEEKDLCAALCKPSSPLWLTLEKVSENEKRKGKSENRIVKGEK
jgi:hypothetical protein